MFRRRHIELDRAAEKGANFWGAVEVMRLKGLPDSRIMVAMDALRLAVDAQPALTTTPNAGIPNWLTTVIDPDIIKVLFAPNKIAQIFGEARKGTWVDQTAMFPIVEHTGEVSSYGDWNPNGQVGVNFNFPQRQAYLYQLILEWGELEMERAGLARISWVAEKREAAVTILNKFQDLVYAFGVANLQNYGLLNDPNETAALTPSVKAAGGTAWIRNGEIVATANEIFADIQALMNQVVGVQSAGQVEIEDEFTLAMSPSSQVAMTATNSFGVNVADLLKKNFPGLKVKTSIHYGQTSASNPQGVAAGNFVQLIADRVGGQRTGYTAFNEKLKTHPLVVALSSWQQKNTQGAWGSIVRMPLGIASMIGV